MNQTRTLLIAAWLFVAALLWMAWNKEQAPPQAANPAPAVAASASQAAVPSVPALPDAAAGVPPASGR